MGFITSIVLFFSGVIAAAGLIVDRYPRMAGFVNNLRKYHLIVGMVTLVLGILNLISLLNIGMPMFKWVFILTISAVMIVLGILEGYPTVHELLRKNPELSNRAREVRDKLWNYQEFLGIVAIVLAIIRFIFGH